MQEILVYNTFSTFVVLYCSVTANTSQQNYTLVLMIILANLIMLMTCVCYTKV